MCGIFGIVFDREREDLGKVLVRAGRRLSYRGYDSVGCGAFLSDHIELRKDAGTIEEVSNRLKFEKLSGKRGIIQLRWATYGKPSYENAQPHYDCDRDSLGAHNGNISNTLQLIEDYIRRGHQIRGQNDGEIVVHSVEQYLDTGLSPEESFRKSLDELEGDFAFVMGRLGENDLYALKMGSSLYLGMGEDFVCCSSDLPSILEFTDRYVALRDGEFVQFNEKNYRITNLKTGQEVTRDPVVSTLTIADAEKGNFPHFMLKEIYEQTEVSGKLIRAYSKSKEHHQTIEAISKARHIFLCGSGTSYHALLLGSYFISGLTGLPAHPVIASQFIPLYGNAVTDDDLLIAVSQSGETKDLINAINFTREKCRARIIGIVNNIGSTIALSSDLILPIHSNLEISVPATKTFTNQAILFLILAMAIKGANQGDTLERIPHLIRETIERSDSSLDSIVEELAATDDLYCLGYGLSHPIALEGALKIKEIVAVHCEGAYSAEFKHGPLSIIKEGYPVIFVMNSLDIGTVTSHVNEVTCRDGRAIMVLQEGTQVGAEISHRIDLPTSPTPEIEAILSVIPLQLLAYRLAVKRGLDPDRPRNLSKTLTVD